MGHYDGSVAVKRRVTIRDVAQAAGVSTTTVSDALSGNGRLPAATRRRVSAVAGRLGYRANPAARSLRGQRVGNFAYYMELAAGAASQALADGLALTLIPHSLDPAKLTAFPLDGLVAVDPVIGDPVVRAFSQLGVPVVTCERDLTPGAEHAGTVEGDYRPAMADLLDHLAAQGALRTALVAPGPETAWGVELRAAYQAWCSERGVPELLFDIPFNGSPEVMHAASIAALRADPPADAIISGLDGSAIGALVAAAEFGRRVPEDLLVASCVDSPALRSCSPAITALDLRPAEMGRRLAGLLHSLLDSAVPPGTVQVVPAGLVVRASTSRGELLARSQG
jgi:DNA-binding LacI/PurR family transcriptional regulator